MCPYENTYFAFRTTARQGVSVLLQDELQCKPPTDLQNGATRNCPQQDDFTTVPSNFTATAKTQLQQNSVFKVTLWDLSVYPQKSSLWMHRSSWKNEYRYIGPSLKRNRNRKEHNALTYFLKFWNFASLQRWPGICWSPTDTVDFNRNLSLIYSTIWLPLA